MMNTPTSSSPLDYRGFFVALATARGAKEILLISFISSFGIGCVIGVIPYLIADRYARIYHGHTGDDCGSLDASVKPAECQAGTDDAQAAAAWANIAYTILACIFNPVFGSMADCRGRRNIMIASLLLSCLPAAFLLWTQILPRLDPFWYYLTYSLGGILSYSGVVFASLSDSVPEVYRAPSYGMLLAILYIGFAASPSVALLLGHRNTTVAYLAFMIMATLVAFFCLPETLPPDICQANVQKQTREQEELASLRGIRGKWAWCWYTVSRPVRDISILNRTRNIRLLAGASFLSSMVFSSDATLLLYYIESRLNVNDSDIAKIYFAIGIVGFLLQAGGLQPLVKCLGEHKLLIATFVIGFLHNVVYGLAQTKQVVFAAMIIAQLTQLNFPVVSSFISKGVSAHEQGRVQGALSAFNSIARGIGPLSMEFVYHHTKSKTHLGPGFMFIYAGTLDLFGVILIAILPLHPYARAAHESSPLENGGPLEYETFDDDGQQEQDDIETNDETDDGEEETDDDADAEPLIELPQEQADRS